MNFAIFHWRSLKTRVTLFTLAIFLISIWSLDFYASRMLRSDLENQLSEQQYATVSLLAANVDQALALRLKLLTSVAANITPAMMNKAGTLQALLTQQAAFEILFNGGVLAIDPDGIAIADLPGSAQRSSINYWNRDYLLKTLTEGKPSIGQPVIDNQLQQPVFGMAVPIHDTQGKILGALAGSINLGLPNFLNEITDRTYGDTGGAFLVTPQNRMIVAAFDKSRIMEVLPAPGVSPWIDRFMQGYEGSAVAVNPHGLEVLVSVKQVPVAGWYASVILPTAEAFSAIHTLQQRMLIATFFLSLLAGGLTWWMLRRELSSLLAAAKTLRSQSNSRQLPQALPITRQDEIGDLIGGFNQLLETLGLREKALRESEGRFRALADNASALVWISDEDKRCTYFNKVWLEFTGRSLAQEIGKGWEEGLHPDDRQPYLDTYLSALEAQQAFNRDYRLRRHDGQYRWLTVHGVPRHDDQGLFIGFIGTSIDITDRKEAEERLQLAASVFTYAREGILITAADGAIIDVNEAFTRISGYRRDEVLGRNPRMFGSGQQSKEFYAALWRDLAEQGHWYGELRNRHKNGEIYISLQTISAVVDAQGMAQHYVSLLSDITALKAHESELEHIAHYDALTGLPNRSLLADRLHQAMAQAQRRGLRVALAFLDLDGFKAINDQYGHEAGDHLLIAVASRMKHTLREGDTLARLGGDEFVAVLVDLENAEVSTPMLNRLLDAAAQPVQFGDAVLQISASLGVTFYPQANDVAADQLLRQADQAMYQAKLAGKNRYHIFETRQAPAEERELL